MEKQKIGKVFKYFAKPKVAGVKVEKGKLETGDKISFEGHTTDFEQEIGSMQIDQEVVEEVQGGDEVGIKVRERVRPNDMVYKILEE